MSFNLQTLTFSKLGKNEKIPYDLLLLADPEKNMIDEYLKVSDIFISIYQEKIVGVIVLYPLEEKDAEIKNVAVHPDFQRKGIGSYLIDQICKVAKENHYRRLIIGTANSSLGQLYLYQKLGFDMCELRKDFFIQHYAEPIVENGIRAKHMIILEKYS